MNTHRKTLSKSKLYPLAALSMLLMAAVLVLLALGLTRVGLLLLVYGAGVQLIIRAVLEWTDRVPAFYWRLLLGAGIVILISSFHLIS